MSILTLTAAQERHIRLRHQVLVDELARLKLERLHLAGPQDEAEMDRQANQIGLWAEAEMLAFDIGLGYTPVPAAPPTQ
jgi:hypothetical protein